jgi:hypothetical protein
MMAFDADAQDRDIEGDGPPYIRLSEGAVRVIGMEWSAYE